MGMFKSIKSKTRHYVRKAAHEAAMKKVSPKKLRAELENKRLREALEFYADENNYYTKIDCVGDDGGEVSMTFSSHSPLEADEGKRAREALELGGTKVKPTHFSPDIFKDHEEPL